MLEREHGETYMAYQDVFLIPIFSDHHIRFPHFLNKQIHHDLMVQTIY